MQLVSFKKMRIRTTRRLASQTRGEKVEPLFVAWRLLKPEYGGQQLLFDGHNFTIKNNRFGNRSLFALI